jgi:hypothetical protein
MEFMNKLKVSLKPLKGLVGQCQRPCRRPQTAKYSMLYKA